MARTKEEIMAELNREIEEDIRLHGDPQVELKKYEMTDDEFREFINKIDADSERVEKEWERQVKAGNTGLMDVSSHSTIENGKRNGGVLNYLKGRGV